MHEVESANSYAQEESSFTERYMAEGAVSGVRKMPSGRRSAKAVTVSIPYGEESGGLFESIRKMIGRRSAPEPDPENLQWNESPIYEAASGEEENSEAPDTEETSTEDGDSASAAPFTPASGVRDGDGALGRNHSQAMALSDEIMTNKRSFAGFSIKDGSFSAVKSSIAMLQQMLALSYPGKLSTEATAIMDQYSAVIRILRDYVEHITEKGGGRSPSGKARLDLVSQLIPLYEKDRQYFGVVADSLSAGDASGIKSWDDVLYNARAEDLSRDNAKLSTVGNGSSIITKRTTEDGRSEFIKKEERSLSKNEEGMFSGQEVMDMYRGISGASSDILDEILAYFRSHPITGRAGVITPERCVAQICSYIINENRIAENKAKRKEEMSDEEYAAENRELFREQVKSHKLYTETVFKDFLDHMISSDAETDKLLDFFNFNNKKSVESEAVDYSGIRFGATISDRNVSTSILAGRLGMSDIVASSRTMLIENANGETARANSMEGAEGKEIKDWRKAAEKEEKEDKKLIDEKKAEGPPLQVVFSYTPKALMQLNELVVLDLIAGQGDRNAGNYFFTVEKTPKDKDGKSVWYLTSVKVSIMICPSANLILKI